LLQHDGIATFSKGYMTVQPSDCLDVSQIEGNRKPIPSCANAPNAASKALSQQANFTSLEDSAKYTFRILAHNLQLSDPPRIRTLAYAASCEEPSRRAVCLSPLEAEVSLEQSAYVGMSLLIVSGRGSGYYSRNISEYVVSGSVNSGERRVELQEDIPGNIALPDASSVVAIFSLGEYRYGMINPPRAAWLEYIPGRHIDVKPSGRPGEATLAPLIDKWLRVDSGRGRGVVRRIISVNEINSTLHVDPPIPTNLLPEAGDTFEILEYQSVTRDLAGDDGSGVQLHGPPTAPSELTAVQTFSGSALFHWQQPRVCDTKPGVLALCDATEAYLEAKTTHNSGDFLVQGAWGDHRLVVGVNPHPELGRGLFTNLAPLASFRVRVRVRHHHVIDFGGNSNTYNLKLTDNPPASTATVGLLTDLGSSDSMVLTWTIPGTLDFDTPPYVTNFMVRIGEDEAPIAGGLLAQTGRVETVIYAQEPKQQTILRDYLDPDTGQMKVFERSDVCTYKLDLVRHPYAADALALNPDALECRAIVYGLEPARIYVFRVHTGNMFGFETKGSNLMFGEMNIADGCTHVPQAYTSV